MSFCAIVPQAGTIDVIGSDVEFVSAGRRSFAQNEQDVAVDRSDCVTGVQISSLQYCSDQDENHAAVMQLFGSTHVPLVQSSCSS